MRVIETHENKISGLEKQKMILEEKATYNAKPRKEFCEILELSLSFLVNPYKLWVKGTYDIKRIVLKLAFKEPFYYIRKHKL